MVQTLAGASRIARLYRLATALSAIVLMTIPATAQLRSTKPKKAPRAIAVVRWQTNTQGKAVPRLLPVAILDEGKYYDASLYKATPGPMALEPGVVYEAQDKGQVLGYFTVKTAFRNPASKQWYGLGEWQSTSLGADELALRERPQTVEMVKEGQKTTSPVFTAPVDDRDIKKKATVYDEEGKEIPAGQEPMDDDHDKPSLKRKQGDIDRLPQVGAPAKKAPDATSAPTKADDDPDRPKLKRGVPGAKTASAPPANAPVTSGTAPTAMTQKTGDDDPNRPILRRGGKGQQKTGVEATETAGASVPGRVRARGDVESAASKQPSGFATRTFEAVAVSDAEDVSGIKQDYRFHWTDSEREELTEKLRKLASQEADKFLRTTVASATTRKPAPAKSQTPASAISWTDRQVAGLDLDFNNSAELVYAASATLESGKTLYVTLVARTDVDGDPRKLYSVVTASDRLDLVPRLELVDAVDADGDRRGELLFRRVRDKGAEFVLYRVGADTLTELFHGGNAE